MGAFAVKTPIYGLHLWLPKAHVEAPLTGSILLAGVLLKLGTYGLLRVLALIRATRQRLVAVVSTLRLWGGLVAALMCLRVVDMKALIAYSSVRHMALAFSGVLTNTQMGAYGAIAMSLSHGMASSALFVLANRNYQVSGSRSLILRKGIMSLAPQLGLL